MTKPWLDNCVPRIDVIECHLRYIFVHAQSFSFVWLFVTLWTIACKAPLSMGFPKKEYWSGLPFPSPGNLPNPGIEPTFSESPALVGEFLKFIYFQLKDNCFTVLCWFLPYINKNQPWVQTCPLPFKPPSHRTPHPISLGCHRAPVWVPWIIQQIPTDYFTYGGTHVSMILSPFVIPSLHPLCPYVCSFCLRLHCSSANRFINTISLDSIHMH